MQEDEGAAEQAGHAILESYGLYRTHTIHFLSLSLCVCAACVRKSMSMREGSVLCVVTKDGKILEKVQKEREKSPRH